MPFSLILKSFPLIIVSLFLLFSCEEKPKNPVSQYGDAMINSYKKGQDAGEAANLDAVRKAVRAYHASNDAYPKELGDVESLIGSTVDFSKYDYDPLTGAVNLKQ
ncbi:MAG: hypothetical protein HZA17_08440 [Nitrospirae bacterium]|nr:hypothetical protein [Nitrospirota bacterium]